MERYAESFRQLAGTFRNMPSRKEKFSEEDIEEIFGEVQRKVCSFCPGWDHCWEKNCARTYREAGAFSGNMLLWDKLPGGYERKFSGGEAEFDVE